MDIEQRLKTALKDVKYYDIQKITFFKRSVRDYFAIAATKQHSKMIRKAFEEMWIGPWQAMCRAPKER